MQGIARSIHCTAMIRHLFLFTALLTLGFAGSSHAQVLLFNNVSQPDNGAEGFNTLETRLATDFVTDDSPWNLKSVRALMANPSPNVTHTVTFRLFKDDG